MKEYNLEKFSDLKFEGVDHTDYPDYVDAFLVSGKYKEKELINKEIEEINNNELLFALKDSNLTEMLLQKDEYKYNKYGF